MRGRTDLHDYQVGAADFVSGTPRCALWVDMGLGKTVITLTVLADLFGRFEIGKVLVVAPPRVAAETWPAEVGNWSHLANLRCTALTGSPTKRTACLGDDADIHTISVHNLKWLVDKLRKCWPYDVVVIDESSQFKSRQSKRFRALDRIKHKFARIIELTGTPAPNGYLDVWPQIKLIDNGERLGKTLTKYRNRFFDSDYMGYTWTLREGCDEIIHSLLHDVVLTLSADDYANLPEKIIHTRWSTLTPALRKKYKQLEDDFLLELDTLGETVIDAPTAAALSMKLRQFCGGALYYEDELGEYRTETLHSLKLDELEVLVEEAGDSPLLVVYEFGFERDAILERFSHAQWIKHIDNVSAKWNAGEIPLLVLHAASAGHGLNLQHGGNNIVWYGLTWSLELYQQLNARLHRQGQANPVVVYHLAIKDAVDSVVLEALDRKDTTQQGLLDAMKRQIVDRGVA